MHNNGVCGLYAMGREGESYEYLEKALSIVFQYNDLGGFRDPFETQLFLKGSIAIWERIFLCHQTI